MRCGCVCLCSGCGCAPPLLAWVCGVGVCASARVSAAPRHSRLGCWGGCVFVCALGLCPATPGWDVRCDVCLGSVSAAARQTWLGCWGVCLLVCALRSHPAAPGSGVRCGCVFWAQVSAAPWHFWLGCLGVCVFVCALRLSPATPDWGVRCGCVCLGSGCGCAPPLLAGVFGCVCVCVRAPGVPRQSWLWCAVWVCVLGLGFWLRPATPGCGVGVSGCLCARSACAPPLLAGVCVVGVWLGSRLGCTPPLLAGVLGCVFAFLRAPLVSRHSWLRTFVCVCVLGSGFRCAPPLLAGVLGCVCVRVRAPPGPLPLLSWVCSVGVCLGCGLGCIPPLLAGVLQCVCFCVGAPPVPRHSWLGCLVWGWVLGLGFRLRPATPGWGVGLCVCLCARSACTPPLLGGVCGVGMCVWARISAAPRNTWPGSWGVCVFVCALRLYPANPGWGVRCGCVCLGSGFGCAPALLAGVLGCVCVCLRTPLVPRHS